MLNWVKWCTSKGEYNFGRAISSTHFLNAVHGAEDIFEQDVFLNRRL